jgi:hypothetical protein
MANFILPLFFHFKKLFDMQIKDQNTDFETRSLDTVCVNESELEHKWHHNIKYLVVGVLFGIYLLKRKLLFGIAFRKCSVSSLFICMD